MHELKLVRESYPEASAAPLQARERARARLRAAVAGRESSRLRPSTRWLRPAAGLVAAAAAAVGIAVGLDTSSDEDASAAALLRKTAVVARAQPALRPPSRGEYLYVKSINAYLTTSVYSERLSFSVLVPRVREIWLGPDGGRMRETSGTPRFLSARDRAAWVTAGRPALHEPRSDTTTEGYEPVALPSDPDALYERLADEAAGHSEGVAQEMFTLVGDALRETAATPAQRAALYEVASRIDGVEFVGPVTDSVGRRGVAVAMTSEADGIRHMLVFDPETAELLAEEQRVIADNPFGYPAGTRIGYATYVHAGLVGSPRERPNRS